MNNGPHIILRRNYLKNRIFSALVIKILKSQENMDGKLRWTCCCHHNSSYVVNDSVAIYQWCSCSKSAASHMYVTEQIVSLRWCKQFYGVQPLIYGGLKKKWKLLF